MDVVTFKNTFGYFFKFQIDDDYVESDNDADDIAEKHLPEV